MWKPSLDRLSSQPFKCYLVRFLALHIPQAYPSSEIQAIIERDRQSPCTCLLEAFRFGRLRCINFYVRIMDFDKNVFVPPSLYSILWTPYPVITVSACQGPSPLWHSSTQRFKWRRSSITIVVLSIRCRWNAFLKKISDYCRESFVVQRQGDFSHRTKHSVCTLAAETDCTGWRRDFTSSCRGKKKRQILISICTVCTAIARAPLANPLWEIGDWHVRR
jgi:hypothetical protein